MSHRDSNAWSRATPRRVALRRNSGDRQSVIDRDKQIARRGTEMNKPRSQTTLPLLATLVLSLALMLPGARPASAQSLPLAVEAAVLQGAQV